MSLTVRRVLPGPRAEIPAGLVYAGAFEPSASLPVHVGANGGSRPHVVLSMIASVDGHTTSDGVSGPLAPDRADREIFLSLRDQVDAVLAGTMTIEKEGYRRLIPEPARRAARAARGLTPEPLAVVVSRSGAGVTGPSGLSLTPGTGRPVPALLTDPEQRRAIYTGPDADLVRVLADLSATHGVRTLLCEGGPRLNAALLDAGLVDEILLTISPLLLGGDAATVFGGMGLVIPTTLDLVSVHERNGALFLRYRVDNAATSDKVTRHG